MIEIIDSEVSHVRELSETLREEDSKEALRLGMIPNRALFNSYRKAVYRKTCLIDGEVAAMWGVLGTLMGISGQPYLVTGTKALTVSPIRFARIYKQETLKMKELFLVLENYVDAEYKGAVRLLEISGFKLDPPIEYNNSLFRKFSMVSN